MPHYTTRSPVVIQDGGNRRILLLGLFVSGLSRPGTVIRTNVQVYEFSLLSNIELCQQDKHNSGGPVKNRQRVNYIFAIRSLNCGQL